MEAIVRAGGRRSDIYAGLRTFRDKYAEKIAEPDIPRRVSGYNLPWLLPEKGFDVAKSLVGIRRHVGSVAGSDRAVASQPPVRSLLVLGYPDVYHAGDHIPEVMEAGPISLEEMTAHL